MNELARLARAVLDRLREHDREDGVNTKAPAVNTEGPGVNTLRLTAPRGRATVTGVFTCSRPGGDERVNTVPQGEHGNENAVNTPAGLCPSCGGVRWWRPRGDVPWRCWACDPPPEVVRPGFQVLAVGEHGE